MVAVLYEWNVATTKAWMNVMGPIGRPVFRWNHDYVMRAGGRGLARRLGVELVAAVVTDSASGDASVHITR